MICAQGSRYANSAYSARVHRFRPVIGLVGGIGSGKSEVARVLAELGCEVCVSDDLARRVLAEPDIGARIEALLGPGIRSADGLIDRAALARAIFTSPSDRRVVEEIMHPRIEQLRRVQFAAAPDTAPALIIDAPLLLEVGLDRECDAVLFVDAPLSVRLARVASGRGWSLEELERRERVQMPLAGKRKRASDVLVNAGSRDELRSSVARFLEAVVARGPRVE